MSPVAGAPWTPPEVIHGAPESVRALNHTAGITPLESQREAAGISQRELARRTGISQATLSRIEAGQEPSQGQAELIGLALDAKRGEGGPVSQDGDMSQHSDTPQPDADEGSPALTPPAPGEQYPAAPTDPPTRRAYLNARNAAVQDAGVKPARGITFGAKS